ncbi:MAG: HIT domain-containing protein [Candidatus Saccharimonadales bacterium]
MQDSIFTKIIKGEIPCHKIYEDKKTFAFLDIHPSTEGHTLVIPKKQVEFLWDLTDEDYKAVMTTVKKLGVHLRERLDVPYVGVKVIGTDVPHAHVHLIPFSSANEYAPLPDMSAEPDHTALAEIAKKLAL